MPKRRVACFVATMAGVIAIDQFTKGLVRTYMVQGHPRPVIEGVLWLTRVKNTGAAFGILDGHRWPLVLVAVVALAVVVFVAIRLSPRSVLARTALALIAGGAAGNLIDRAVSGGVTDFLDLGWWPVFNVADMCLDVGVAMLVWWLLFSKEHAHDGASAGGDPSKIASSADE